MADLRKKKKKSRTGPFLRWAGGKRRLAPLMLELVADSIDEKDGQFYDPFLGGGAIPFAIASDDSLNVPLVLSDINKVLIDAYLCVQSMNSEFLDELSRIQTEFDLFDNESVYNELRALFNLSLASDEKRQAARFVALNTTCFNGLWRENSSGEFNVPFGKVDQPAIFDLESLHICSNKLANSSISCSSFIEALAPVRAGDVVLLDPPYLPLTSTSSFSAYHGSGFGVEEHKVLANEITRVINLGADVILCNSFTPITVDIYGSSGLTLQSHLVGRSIAADGDKRENVVEVIGTSFEIPEDAMNDFGLSVLEIEVK